MAYQICNWFAIECQKSLTSRFKPGFWACVCALCRKTGIKCFVLKLSAIQFLLCRDYTKIWKKGWKDLTSRKIEMFVCAVLLGFLLFSAVYIFIIKLPHILHSNNMYFNVWGVLFVIFEHVLCIAWFVLISIKDRCNIYMFRC